VGWGCSDLFGYLDLSYGIEKLENLSNLIYESIRSLIEIGCHASKENISPEHSFKNRTGPDRQFNRKKPEPVPLPVFLAHWTVCAAEPE
jgi:hypothetical protein